MLVGGGWQVEHPVELVIFDCDGVLIDSEAISNRTLVQALAEHGYHVDEKHACRHFVGRSYASILKDVEEDLGRKLPASFEADHEQATLKAMREELQAIPGIATALSMIGQKRCVASSSSVEWIRLGLKRTGLIHHLEPHLFSASMVKDSKPAPDIFLYAARQMEVQPERSVVVEDSIPGVEAGVAAGMTVIGFTGGGHIVDPDHGDMLRSIGAHHVINDMKMLPSLFKR